MIAKDDLNKFTCILVMDIVEKTVLCPRYNISAGKRERHSPCICSISQRHYYNWNYECYLLLSDIWRMATL